MKETQGTKETEGTRWRVGIVAPGFEPCCAIDPEPVGAEGIARRLADEDGRLPDGCAAFAVASRSAAIDRGIAASAAMCLVRFGDGKIPVVGKVELQRPVREIVADGVGDAGLRSADPRHFLFGLLLGLLVGISLGFCLFSEHAPLRVADDHAQEESAGRAEDFPGGDRNPVRESGRLAPVTLGFVGAAALEGDGMFKDGDEVVAESLRRGLDAKKPGAAEFVDEGIAVGRVVGDGRAVAGGVAEDGELEVVHAAESTTGTDKLSVDPATTPDRGENAAAQN